MYLNCFLYIFLHFSKFLIIIILSYYRLPHDQIQMMDYIIIHVYWQLNHYYYYYYYYYYFFFFYKFLKGLRRCMRIVSEYPPLFIVSIPFLFTLIISNGPSAFLSSLQFRSNFFLLSNSCCPLHIHALFVGHFLVHCLFEPCSPDVL